AFSGNQTRGAEMERDRGEWTEEDERHPEGEPKPMPVQEEGLAVGLEAQTTSTRRPIRRSPTRSGFRARPRRPISTSPPGRSRPHSRRPRKRTSRAEPAPSGGEQALRTIAAWLSRPPETRRRSASTRRGWCRA